MAGKLKVLQLKSLEAGLHSDGAGLYLNVEESGSRSWLLRVTIRGKRHWIGLGSLSSVFLADAREAAQGLRAKARKGIDVLEEKKAEKEAEKRAQNPIPTFAEVARKVHADSKKTFSEQHAYNWLQSLRTYVFPIFGKKTVDKINSADVLAAIGPIWNTVPDTAGRTLRRVKAVFDYCAVSGYRNVMVNDVAMILPNPCESIRAALPKHNGIEKHHEALPYAELPAFIQKLRTSQSALSVKLAFEFLILTASRTSEVLNAKWKEFVDPKVWTVPAERMKEKKEHKVPLSPRCLEILELAREFNDSEIVFPGRYEGHGLSQMALLMALRRLGYDSLTAHGFRSSFKDWSEETTKFDSLVIEASLAHAVKGIERHYLRTTFFDQRKKLMNAWATFATSTPAARVVQFDRSQS